MNSSPIIPIRFDAIPVGRPANILMLFQEFGTTGLMIMFLFLVIASLSFVLYSRLIFARKLNRFLDAEISSRTRQLYDTQSSLTFKNEEIKRLSEKILNQQAQLVIQQQVLKKSVDELKRLHQSTDLNLQEVLRKGPAIDSDAHKNPALSSRVPSGIQERSKAVTKSDQEFLLKVTAVIEANIANPNLDHKILCDQMAMSKSVFYSRFKHVTGQGLQEFIKVMRLKNSTRLLSEGNMNIHQIAMEVGFNSQSYYNKCFIRQYGVGPKAYSKMMKESNVAGM
jgi:AraC-like DNA-binding protein